MADLPSFDDAWQQFEEIAGDALTEEMGLQSPVAPVDGGTLAASHAWRDSEGTLEIYSGDERGPIAQFVIRGTAPHPIDPVYAKMLHWVDLGTGDDVFAHHVDHPGTQPNPYNVRAWEARRDDLVREFARLCGRDRVLAMLNPFRKI